MSQKNHYIVFALLMFLFQLGRAQVDSMLHITYYEYDDHGNLIRETEGNHIFDTRLDDDGIFNSSKDTYYYYPSALSQVSFHQKMYANRVWNLPIKVRSIIRNQKETSLYLMEKHFIYDTLYYTSLKSEYYMPLKKVDSIPDFYDDLSFNYINGNYIIGDEYRRPYTVDKFDNYGRPLQITDEAGLSSILFYSEAGLLVGIVLNATLADIAYTNFIEYDIINKFSLGWSYQNLQYDGNYRVTMPSGFGQFDTCEKDGLNPQKDYILSYWCLIDNPTNGITNESSYLIDTHGGQSFLLDTMSTIYDHSNNCIFKKYTYKIKETSKVTLVRKTSSASGNLITQLRLHSEGATMSSSIYRGVAGSYLIVSANDKYNNSSAANYIYRIDDSQQLIIYDKYLRTIITQDFNPRSY